MADLLVVRVTGKIGLGWADDLRAVLGDATGLSWEQDSVREVAETGDAQGVDTIILVSALTSVVDVAVKAALHQAHEAVAEWRRRRLDPPDVEVVRESGDRGDSAAEHDTVGG